jgi:ELWxxDGT repeat protein
VKDLAAGTDGSNPTESKVYDGNLYFSAGGATPGLWKKDGTAAGTMLVKADLTNAHFSPVWNNKLHIVKGNGGDYPLWQSDGTTAGTITIRLQNTAGPVSSLNNGFQFVVYNGELYFSGECNLITVG